MIDFGFKIGRSSAIDLSAADTKLYERVRKVQPDITNCMACGACSATCTASSLSGMSVRKVILGLQRGQDIRPLLTKCMLCGKCLMVCPRGINTRKLILTVCRLYD